ncbi:MAG: glutamate carboxypeptidase [Chloroflexota bacterium]|jgi:glutamate carboxypeptidase|nr:glutamate carboxypeptidase [Chloroflexota bacterium]
MDADTSDLVSPAELQRLRAIVDELLPDYLRDLERLVNIDCGSYTKEGVDEVGRWAADFLREQLGATVEVDENDRLGNTVIGTVDGVAEGPAALLIGHMDTVFDPGTAAVRPFRTDDGIAYGPGVTDMKSGLLTGLYALKALRILGDGVRDGSPGADSSAPWLPVGRVVFIANPDEEIGSPVSSPLIRRAAASADLALVLECARANGDIVSSRKGIVDLHLTIHGRAAHAGVEPEKGRSAALEAAHKTIALHALNGRWPGVTVNVGVIEAGTRPNVIAERALLKVDIRALTRAALEEAEAAVREIAAASSVPDVVCEVEERGRHWPMEKLERSTRLVDTVKGIARSLGFDLNDAATGGASDANTTAGLGVPTIDGLGPVGGNDHSPAEYLEMASIVPRTAMLAGLLLAAGRDPVVGGWRPTRGDRTT